MTDYYGLVRSEIAPLLPPRLGSGGGRVLDFGCGAGETLNWLRQIYPAAEMVGIDANRALQERLQRNADRAIFIEPHDRLPANLGQFDLVLALDVLEHLADPLSMLRQLVAQLAPGGSVIVSLPNVAHYSVVMPLLMRRRFAYQDAGILDRTHLRFFVEDTALALMNDAGLVVDAGVVNGLQRRRNQLINLASFGLLRHRMVEQYIMRGHVAGGAFAQARVAWQATGRHTAERARQIGK